MRSSRALLSTTQRCPTARFDKSYELFLERRNPCPGSVFCLRTSAEGSFISARDVVECFDYRAGLHKGREAGARFAERKRLQCASAGAVWAAERGAAFKTAARDGRGFVQSRPP